MKVWGRITTQWNTMKVCGNTKKAEGSEWHGVPVRSERVQTGTARGKAEMFCAKRQRSVQACAATAQECSATVNIQLKRRAVPVAKVLAKGAYGSYASRGRAVKVRCAAGGNVVAVAWQAWPCCIKAQLAGRNVGSKKCGCVHACNQ